MAHHHVFRAENLPRSEVKKTVVSKAMTIVAYVAVFWILLPVFLLFTGFRLDILWPIAIPLTSGSLVAGWVLVSLGSFVIVASTAQLWYQGKGLPISDLPPSHFVSAGFYRLWRHPIYVGFTLLFAGVTCFFGSPWCLAFSTPLLLLGWIAYVLYFEEPVLIERFGSAYLDYRKRVPLLFPRLSRRSNDARAGSPSVQSHVRLNTSLKAFLNTFLNKIANHTILFRRGRLIVVTYGLFLSIGAMLTTIVMSTALIQHGLSTGEVGGLVVALALAVGPVGWIFWWAGNAGRLIHERYFGLGQIGFISYGALTASAIVIVFMARLLDVQIFLLSDALMVGLFVVYAVGRIGCLTYGCCYGKQTTGPIGVVYENENAKMIRLGDRRKIARHPVQLYAAGHGLLALLLLNAMAYATIPAGLLTAAGLMLAGIGRTYTESYRDRERTIFGRFTWGHVGGWITFVIGCAMLWIVAPVVDADAPIPFRIGALLDNPGIWPFVAIVGVIVLIVFGVHWKRVGVWFE